MWTLILSMRELIAFKLLWFMTSSTILISIIISFSFTSTIPLIVISIVRWIVLFTRLLLLDENDDGYIRDTIIVHEWYWCLFYGMELLGLICLGYKRSWVLSQILCIHWFYGSRCRLLGNPLHFRLLRCGNVDNILGQAS